MNEWLKLVLLTLVCFRVAQFIAFDEGPFGMFQWVRGKAGAYDYDAQGHIRTGMGRLITCPYCLGVWIAIPLAFIASGIQWYSPIWWLAIAGLQAFLQGLTSR